VSILKLTTINSLVQEKQWKGGNIKVVSA